MKLQSNVRFNALPVVTIRRNVYSDSPIFMKNLVVRYYFVICINFY